MRVVIHRVVILDCLMEKLKWYQKTRGIALLIVVFFPIGLFQMWRHATWHVAVKCGLTLFFAWILFGEKPEGEPGVDEVGRVELVEEIPTESEGAVRLDAKSSIDEPEVVFPDEVEDEEVSTALIEFNVESIEPMGSVKANIDIRLTADATQEELTELAQRLRQEYRKYQNLFIFYYLPGQSKNDMAWATSHFTPGLAVRILGATAEQSREIEQVDDVPGRIQGAWKSTMMGLSMVYVLYEKEEKQWAMRIKLAGNGRGGAQSADEPLQRKRKKGEVRFISQKRPSEYYVIGSDGKLRSYDAEGLIEVMTPLDN